MRKKWLTRVPIYSTPTPTMNDLAPHSETSNFHNDASNIASQAQQIVIYGGQQNHL
jgi:hypothetical protein